MVQDYRPFQIVKLQLADDKFVYQLTPLQLQNITTYVCRYLVAFLLSRISFLVAVVVVKSSSQKLQRRDASVGLRMVAEYHSSTKNKEVLMQVMQESTTLQLVLPSMIKVNTAHPHLKHQSTLQVYQIYFRGVMGANGLPLSLIHQQTKRLVQNILGECTGPTHMLVEISSPASAWYLIIDNFIVDSPALPALLARSPYEMLGLKISVQPASLNG